MNLWRDLCMTLREPLDPRPETKTRRYLTHGRTIGWRGRLVGRVVPPDTKATKIHNKAKTTG